MTPLALSFPALVQDALAEVERSINGLSVVDSMLLAVAAGLLWYVWSGVRALTMLGPVEIPDLQCDDDQLAAKGFTAALREHLATAGLMPSPEVPAGAPQTDVLAAVEASPIPQAGWLASLLRAIPRPRPASYRLDGTLRMREDDGRCEGCVCGITYWLRDTVRGTQTEVRTTWAKDYEAAVAEVASSAYIAITRSAVHVYPRWATWSSREAFEQYGRALSLLVDSRGTTVERQATYRTALSCCEAARDGEPRNLLPRLQLANIIEKQATLEHGCDALGRRVDAVVQYLEIADAVPSLVEARYRASVLLSVLAAQAGQLGDAHWKRLTAQGVRGASTSEERGARLREHADRQAHEAIRWLKPYATVLRRRRLRNRFEPTRADRRRLKATVRISRHCRHAREWVGRTDNRRRTLLPREIWWHLLTVRSLAFVHGQGTWQAEYNAASLYALLYALPARRESWRRRAIKHLERIVEDPLAELREDWLVRGDPDLDKIRHGDDWHRIVRRYCRAPDADGSAPPSTTEPSPERVLVNGAAAVS